MLTFIIEAAVRSSALIAAVWVFLKVSRMCDLSTEKRAWTVVVAASLAMPLLMWSVVVGAMTLEVMPAPLADSIGSFTGLPNEEHPLTEVLLVVYLLGVGTFAGRLGVGLLKGAHLRRQARPVPAGEAGLDVRVSTQVQSPVSFGSTVLLPACSADWDPYTLRAVLAHEREHVRNRDSFRLWVASLCRAVFWFNPLVHWLYRRLAILIELTSDVAASRAVGDRSAYVNVLLKLATGTPTLQVGVPMVMRATLPERIRELLAPGDLPVPSSAKRNALFGSIVLILTTMMAACGAKPVTGAAADAALHVTQHPTGDELKKFYPRKLRQQHIEGMVLVRLTVDASGRVVKTRIVKETPAGVGLGEAAESVAREYRFDNSLHRPVSTNLPVKFKLQNPQPGPQPATPAPG